MSNGNTTVSPIPSSASSARIASEYPATPNLAAEYAVQRGGGGEVDDLAARRAQPRECGPDRVGGADEVDPQDPLEVLR